MKVFIYACEGQYQGLHGISDQRFVEVETVEEAYEWGNEMAEEVINSYGLRDEMEEDEEDGFGVEEETYVTVWEVRKDVDLTIDELNEACSQYDCDTLVEEYCEAEAI